MPSSAPADKLKSNLRVRSFHHDPDSTSATLLTASANASAYQDMRDAECLLVVVMLSAVTTEMTLIEIVADDDTAFGSPTVIKTSSPESFDNEGNYGVIEISEQDLQAVGVDDLRYVTARLTSTDATDEATVTLIAKLKRPHEGATSDETG